MRSSLMLNEHENKILDQMICTFKDVSMFNYEKKLAYASPCPCGGTCAGECTGAGCTGTYEGCILLSG